MTKICGNKNSTTSPMIMVNYHYHSKNMVIIQIFPSMLHGKGQYTYYCTHVFLYVRIKANLTLNNHSLFVI